MKKKILFIMESLRIGGAEKSLITILSMIDYSKYDVELFLFTHNGEFMEFLPKEVKILSESENYQIFSKDRKLAPFEFLKKLEFKRAYHSLIYLVKCLYYKIVNQLYIGWEHIQYMFDNIEGEYEASIAFLERKTIYFNIDKVKAKKKIGFIHTDYSRYPYDYKVDKRYFKSYAKIVAVSEHSKDVLVQIFPEYEEKFLVIQNIISKKLIRQMADEELDIEREQKITIATVARLVTEKGIDSAIEICKMLIDNKYDVKWYVIGSGDEEKKLKKKIMKNNLQDRFILVGAQKNPYKWIKNCDVYVQPSKVEGFGITVSEAKILAKPMVVSEIPAFKEQIFDGENGYLAKNNEIMYNRIVELIENKNEIINRFIANLEQDNSIENREELEKLYGVIDG